MLFRNVDHELEAFNETTRDAGVCKRLHDFRSHPSCSWGGSCSNLVWRINQKTSSIWKNLAYLYWGIKITTDKINNYVIHRSLIVPRRKKIQGTGYNYQHFTEPSRINLKKEPSRLLKFFAPTCRRTGFKEIVHIRKKVERNVHNWR